MCHLSELPQTGFKDACDSYIYIYIFDFWVETGVPVLDDIYIRLRGAHVSESFIYS